ncbi:MULTISPECIES: aldo/keto reductase [unclassified Janthinobacterium]|uniref:aldo/keto reductase n=1 Tax=unclassified Janthinobacterium TaxID=2610881 RepID=UPI001622B620|nr:MULTISPECIES: aldo/keto reductase [unclassified Janthinobacterium]MBB5607861.1 aryl-alcohol dehydrogenase-like predicted oxidoreductase [Janthinobacterium sp. S3T4]MBB5612990.1 aryl-alcohol dehydrogenase-like predicted oxidoreductase [Janthinobacterium sp. S3M3]
MQHRTIGNSGLRSSALGLGCMGMSEFYGATDEVQSLATLAAALDAGVTLFDTADAYGFGHNEQLLGRFLRGRRQQALIASKCGLAREPGAYARRIDNSPAYIRQACEASLTRLGVETIDLYYLHRVNLDTPLEESMGALAQLVQEGKIRAVGLCEVSAATLLRAAAIHPVAAVQSEYSLWSREPEQGVLAACRQVGASFVAYSPLGRGFLTGAIGATASLDEGDFRQMNPRFAPENLPYNLAIVDMLRQLAISKHCTPAQLALAWLLAQGEDIIAIPGTKRIAYLQDNLGALQVTLSKAELALIGAAFPPGIAAGARYTAEGMKGVNV